MKKSILIFGLIVFLYTRFLNLNWGLPYPMHPDERNMAVAVTEISLAKPYSPNFWAYGGFQMNLAHVLLSLRSSVVKNTSQGFLDAILALRNISAFSSILTLIFGLRIISLLVPKNNPLLIIFYLLVTFSPGLIQFAHFGTTESSLILFNVVLLYYSLKIIKKYNSPNSKDILYISLAAGLAVATKISAVSFAFIPCGAIVYKFLFQKRKRLVKKIIIISRYLLFILILTTILTVIFSPHYFLYFDNFRRSVEYETALVTGKIDVFYTRQFINTSPVIFQFVHILPYLVGLPVSLLSLLGFLTLSWRRTEHNLLRAAFLLQFLPNAFLFAKWTRYMAPLIPLMLIFAVLFLHLFCRQLGYFFRIFITSKRINQLTFLLFSALIVISIVPGVAFMSVYQGSDIRFLASKWIFSNIPENSYILSETANVIDIPMTPPDTRVAYKNYTIVNFDFYDVDDNPQLYADLIARLEKADYIFIPSRRIFANYMRLPKRYPLAIKYYQLLFSGKLGFEKIAEITSFPQLEIGPFMAGEFDDEKSEETWTVFDHPVIRIYRKTVPFTQEGYRSLLEN